MTDKKQRILHTALKLFATKGYANTSTLKVSQEAGVSEGLIFRHFRNKAGLLNAILTMAKEAALLELAAIGATSDPREKIKQMLELPYKINPETYEMWRLTYALKWQIESYDNEAYEGIYASLESAFQALGYKDPASEVKLLFILLDGAATTLLLHPPDNKTALLNCLLKKYDL